MSILTSFFSFLFLKTFVFVETKLLPRKTYESKASALINDIVNKTECTGS